MDTFLTVMAGVLIAPLVVILVITGYALLWDFIKHLLGK